MTHRKPRGHQDQHGLQGIACSLMVVWGVTVGFDSEVNLVHILVALVVGLGLLLVWQRTADFGSRIITAFIGCTGCWAISFAIGMCAHWQLTPLLS